MTKYMLSQMAKALPSLLVVWLLVACGGGNAPPEPTDTIAPNEAREEPQGDEADEPSSASVEPTTDGRSVAERSDGESLVGTRVLTIDQSASEARFLVDEVLLGADKTVVGVTSQVSGTISVDPVDPSSTEVSIITIDARDLTTDSSRRNRSIQRQILRSALEENRYITFEPTAIDGLPDTVAIGESFSFNVTGDLTVRGETRQETFELSVTPISPNEVAGLGTTVIRYADYGISIPSVPAVASVEDEVRLELEFVAVAAE